MNKEFERELKSLLKKTQNRAAVVLLRYGSYACIR